MRERGYTDRSAAHAEDIVNAKHKTGKVRELIVAGPTRPCSTRCIPCRRRTFRSCLCSKGIPSRRDLRGSDSEPGAAGKDLRKMAIAK